MTEQKHLAFASVPSQSWGKIYEQKDAFKQGTIFPDLDKPFYITAQGDTEDSLQVPELGSEEEMLLKIQQISFVLDDLRLYLDMHPEEKEGLSLMKSYSVKRKNLLSNFAEQFYPLTPDCVTAVFDRNTDSVCFWQRNPLPWEGGENHVDL